MADSNDIVVTTKANTKEAEASIKSLEEKINKLSATDPKVKKLEKTLESVGKTAKKSSADASKQMTLMSTSMTALQGGLAGIAVSMGAFVTGSLAYAIRSYGDFTANAQAATQKTKAWSEIINQAKVQADSMTNSLRTLDELARDGIVDNDSIKTSISLVQQLADKFGDVGIRVDEATGKISGLENGIKAIDKKTRQAQLDSAKAEKRAAEKELQALKSKHAGQNGSNSFGGSYWGGLQLMLNNPMEYATSIWNNESLNGLYQRRRDTQKAAELEVQGRINSATARVTELEGMTAKEDVEAVTNRARASVERKNFDTKGFDLQNRLATAINSGDVTQINDIKKQIEEHSEEIKRKELEAINLKIEAAKEEKQLADEDLNKRRRNVQDDKQNARIDRANTATTRLSELVRERDSLMASIRLPQVVADASQSTVERIATQSRGTFDSYSLGSLGQNDIEKQQLEALKQIAENTKENNKQPVVGE